MGSFSSNRKLPWSDGNLIARNLPDQPIAEPGCRIHAPALFTRREVLCNAGGLYSPRCREDLSSETQRLRGHKERAGVSTSPGPLFSKRVCLVTRRNNN